MWLTLCRVSTENLDSLSASPFLRTIRQQLVIPFDETSLSWSTSMTTIHIQQTRRPK